MGLSDISALLLPRAADAPCGDNLEYDPHFATLLEASTGKPERVMGGTVIEAQPPDWRAVLEGSIRLFERTKDLRVAVLLARSLLIIDGLPGFRDGLEVISRLLLEYWDTLHPQLEPDDGYDPTARISALSDLCGGETVLKDLRLAPLARSQGMGTICYRDVALATGELKPVDGSVVRDMTEIKGVFLDCPPDALLDAAAAAAGCLAGLRAVERALTEKVSSSNSLDFAPAITLMQNIVRFLDARVAERGLGMAETSPSDEAVVAGDAENRPGPAARLAVSGDITGRDDVIRLLDRICAYYAASEPSSPIPLLLLRAKRLVSKDFISVLQDIAPDAVAQAEAIRGRGEV